VAQEISQRRGNLVIVWGTIRWPTTYYAVSYVLQSLRTSWMNCSRSVWKVMSHAQKPDFVFRQNGQVHLNRQGRQFSRLLAAEVCALTVVMIVMLDTTCTEVVWRVLATHSISQFPLHFPSCASPCAIIFQLDSTLEGCGLLDCCCFCKVYDSLSRRGIWPAPS
jgi:hypothetical protein